MRGHLTSPGSLSPGKSLPQQVTEAHLPPSPGSRPPRAPPPIPCLGLDEVRKQFSILACDQHSPVRQAVDPVPRLLQGCKSVNSKGGCGPGESTWP